MLEKNPKGLEGTPGLRVILKKVKEFYLLKINYECKEYLAQDWKTTFHCVSLDPEIGPTAVDKGNATAATEKAPSDAEAADKDSPIAETGSTPAEKGSAPVEKGPAPAEKEVVPTDKEDVPAEKSGLVSGIDAADALEGSFVDGRGATVGKKTATDPLPAAKRAAHLAEHGDLCELIDCINVTLWKIYLL